MWELWGSKFRPSHWLGTSLIQLLVATAQAVILVIFYDIEYIILLYTVSQKNIPDIFDCNVKKDYRILIIIGTNIPETTFRQVTI